MSEVNGHRINGSNKAWKKVKLGEIAKYINGKAFKPSEWEKTGLPIIRIQNLNNPEAPFNYCNKEVDKKYYVNQGDLLFAWSGTPGTSFGAHIWKGEKAVLNQHIFRIEIDNEKVNRNYFQYALNFKVKEFVAKAHGTAGLAHITKGKFEIAEILLPTLLEQQQIVSKIEELFSELDKSVEQLKTTQQQLKVYRQSVLKWAFEGKLTNDHVKDGELPERWKIECLGNVSEMCLGKMLDKQKNKGTLKPYLGNINVRWGEFNLSDLQEMRFEEYEHERFGLRKGDLVVCEGGEPGRCAVWKYDGAIMIQKALHRVRVAENVDAKYVYYFFNYSALNGSLKRYFTGTTIKHLTGKELKKVELPLPFYKEQQQIVQEIESRLSVCDKIEKTITDSLKQAEALRQSILKKAFEGHIV